jgi:hypothetical protein
MRIPHPGTRPRIVNGSRAPGSRIPDPETPSLLFPLRCLLLASTILQRTPEQKLDLAVQAAQIVVGPALNGLEHLAVNPQQEGFAIGHGVY